LARLKTLSLQHTYGILPYMKPSTSLRLKRACTWQPSNRLSLKIDVFSSEPPPRLPFHLFARLYTLLSRARRPNLTASGRSSLDSPHPLHLLSCLRCMRRLPPSTPILHSMRVLVPPQQPLGSLPFQHLHQKSAQRGLVAYHSATPHLRMLVARLDSP
jgi:hypothetical protein